ncbi:hypothetical protein [Paraburkholderia sp. 32]|uniref:hypothetical protein n=1 Tax=Paraburkholderia sp. 32 TaxID=2991057 RepID=UPI003D23AF8F
MNAFMQEVVRAAKESPKLFFAPLTGAIDAIRREMNHLAAGDRHEPVRHSHTVTNDQR